MYLIINILFLFTYFLSSEERCYDFITESERILPFDGNNKNYFGNSVEINNTDLIVGCKFDAENGINSGAVYVYKNVGDEWILQIKLLPTSGGAYKEFGNAVAVDGNYLYVGSQRDIIKGHDSGSVYIFEHIDGNWTQKTIVTPSDGKAGDLFGQYVATSNGILVVNCNSNSRLAYIFQNNAENWTEYISLVASDGKYIDMIGHSFAIYGNRIIVGRWYDDSVGYQSGSAIIFKNNGSTWLEEAKLTPSDGASLNKFGLTVAIDDNYVVISSHGDDVKGDGSGSVYVYEMIQGNWTEQIKLVPNDGKARDSFGYPIATNNNRIIIGCIGKDAAGPNSGAVYMYQKNNGTWNEQYKFLPSVGEYNGGFGYSVAISNKHTVIGSIKHNSPKVSSVYVFNNLDISNKTSLLCDPKIKVNSLSEYLWVIIVSVSIFLVIIAVVTFVICKWKKRQHTYEKGEVEDEFIFHDVHKDDNVLD